MLLAARAVRRHVRVARELTDPGSAPTRVSLRADSATLASISRIPEPRPAASPRARLQHRDGSSRRVSCGLPIHVGRRWSRKWARSRYMLQE